MPYRKDRLGEKLRLARRARENLYFAQRNQRLTQRLRARAAARKSKTTTAIRKNGKASETYLVPVDFSRTSELALKRARDVVAKNNGKLVVLHVLNENRFHSRRIMPRTQTEKQAREEIKRVAARARLQPEEYSCVIAWGRDTALTIANHAKKRRVSLIIMGNHGRTGLTRLMLGSVAERTLRYADCSVLVVKKR
jgi:nucleotide-binding universal stress UspA family protein